MTDAASRCPCGSGLSYGECCGPLHTGARRAATAEQLMRSRYSAYAVGESAYILASWHPSTRPATADVDVDGDRDGQATTEPPLVWRRLEVVSSEKGGPFDQEGTVEFRAFWRQGAERGELHERSRFVRAGGRWLYVDGEVLSR